MSDRICSIEGCNRPLRARGWCTTHHQRWRTTGSLADPVRRPATCTFPGCSNPHNANGLCYGHRTQQRRGEQVRPFKPRYPGTSCLIDGCLRPRMARGMCSLHERRVRLHGNPHWDGRRSELDRFLRYVDKTDTCWLWTGKLNENGYGLFAQKHGSGAHRASWRLHRGSIPDGLEIDHLCRNRSCVNPDHLEPVNHDENMRRAQPFRKPSLVCKRGHSKTGDNLFVRKNGRRECRHCMRITEMERRRAKREAKRRAEGGPSLPV